MPDKHKKNSVTQSISVHYTVHMYDCSCVLYLRSKIFEIIISIAHFLLGVTPLDGEAVSRRSVQPSQKALGGLPPSYIKYLPKVVAKHGGLGTKHLHGDSEFQHMYLKNVYNTCPQSDWLSSVYWSSWTEWQKVNTQLFFHQTHTNHHITFHTRRFLLPC